MADPSTLFWLTSFSLVYLLITSVVLIRNRIQFTSLAEEDNNQADQPVISVCVPARNEEQNIERLMLSICDQSYPKLELLVLDDFSTDATPGLIEEIRTRYPQIVHSVEPAPKPEDWLGKPWACQQLGDQTRGDILLFLDADTVLYPGMIQHVANAFSNDNLDMLTVWPEQELKSFWEKTVVPLIYYALVTLLPATYVYRSPRWIPSFLRKKIAPMFAAACGQCIGFTKDTYSTIGGHRSVKNKVVEDVALAKRVKSKRLTLRMFTGINCIRCRMYRSEKEIFNGLRKNFFPGFDRSLPVFLLMAILHLIVFVLPFFVFPTSIYLQSPALFFVSVASLSLILLHRFILAVWFRWNPLFGFLHPLGVLWFERLGMHSVADHFTGRKVRWKGRDV